jgi:hypothetical protein
MNLPQSFAIDASRSSIFLHAHKVSWRVEWICSTEGRVQTILTTAGSGLMSSKAAEYLDRRSCQVVGVNNNMLLNCFAATPSNRNRE